MYRKGRIVITEVCYMLKISCHKHVFVCSAAGGSQHRRPRDGAASAPAARLPQSLHSSGRSAWASEQDPWGVLSLSLSLFAPLSEMFFTHHKKLRTANSSLFSIPPSPQISTWKWNGNSQVGVSSTWKSPFTIGHVWMFATLLFTLLSHPFPVPLVSRVCPSDVCRIWKSGASLRVDATLLGFENMTWIRGRRSYIFRGDGESLFPLSEAYTQRVSSWPLF